MAALLFPKPKTAVPYKKVGVFRGSNYNSHKQQKGYKSPKGDPDFLCLYIDIESRHTLLFRPSRHRLSDVSDRLKGRTIMTLEHSIEMLKSTISIQAPKSPSTSNFGMNPRAASATRALLRLTLCH
jgi:hypothetical protein